MKVAKVERAHLATCASFLGAPEGLHEYTPPGPIVQVDMVRNERIL